MAFDAHANLAFSILDNSPGTAGLSLEVADGTGSRFPAVPFNATVWPSTALPTPANAEIVRVTAIATDTLTITRAQESTTAKQLATGYYIAAGVTAKSLTDIEGAFPVVTADIANDAVTNAKLANMAELTVKARLTAGTGDPEDVTIEALTAELPALVGDTGSGGTKGLAPAPAAGAAAANKYLHANGTWNADVYDLASQAWTIATGLTDGVETVLATRFGETTAPGTPAASRVVLYALNDSLLHFKNSAGTVKTVAVNSATTVADASGGANVDTEARAQLNALLAALRASKVIAT